MNNNYVSDETRGLITIATENNVIVKPLEKQFNIMLKAVAQADRATWTFYKAVATIINDELYKLDDCETVKAFCEKWKISAPIATRAKWGVDNLKVLKEYGYNESNITLSKSYILSRLAENQKVFLDMLQEKEEEGFLTKVGETELERRIKEFKKMVDKAINGDTEEEAVNESEEAVNESEKAEAESVADEKIKGVISGGYLNLSIGLKVYNISLEDLEEYRV